MRLKRTSDYGISMKPDYAIWADGLLITGNIQSYLVSLRVTDEAGIKSDVVEITLDDRDGKLPLPHTGTHLKLAIGYQETGLTNLGVYIVDEIGIESPPQKITIKGHAADLNKAFKSQQTKTWQPQSLGNIISDIASKNGYQPRIADELASLMMPHLDQTAESDIHFITRLANLHGAIAKPAGGYLLFVPKDRNKSVSGQLLQVISVVPKDSKDWRISFSERNHHGAVVAEYHDVDKAKVIEAKAGSGDPIHRLRETFPTKELAERAANSELKKLTQSTATLNITLVGNPAIVAESKLVLQGFRSGIPADWTVTRVEQAIESSGFTTRVAAEHKLDEAKQ